MQVRSDKPPQREGEPVVPDAPVRVGERVGGKFRVIGLLAVGGVGMVLEAHDEKLDRRVALKLLLPARARDPILAARFEKEARSAVKIKSEHVSQVIELGELEGGQPYMALEYLDGEDLSAVVQRVGRLPTHVAVDYILQACEALAEAHALGLVHRDLKPANLFLANRPGGGRIIKVIDFGLAKTTVQAGDDIDKDTTMTQAGDMVGTPRYMAPEQLRGGKRIDARTDIWALGATLYELLTGHHAFDGRTIADLWEMIGHGSPPSLSSAYADIGPDLEAVVMRCLTKPLDERFLNVAELAAALLPFASPESRVHVVRAARVTGQNVAPPDRFPAKEAMAVGPAPGTATLMQRLHRMAGKTARPRVAAIVITGAIALAIGAVAGTLTALKRGSTPLGGACASDATCSTGSCIDGLCSKRCSGASDCESPALCSTGTCAVPLRVGFVYVGVPQDQGWTFTHELGRLDATERLGYLQTTYRTNVNQPADAERAIDDLVRDGFGVIVANSFTLRDTMIAKAQAYPDTKFLVYAPSVEGPANLGAYYADIYHAWYLAGYAAAQKSKTHRLGFVGSLVLPEVVRDINAFARGARHFDSEARVEVRWIGFWFDPNPPDEQGLYAEDRLARDLIATGCDVIAHHADNGRVVASVEARQQHDILSIGNNSHNACDLGPATCLGVAHVNWGPLYVQIFEDMHHHRWNPSNLYLRPIRANPEESIVQFSVRAAVAGPNVNIRTAELLSALSRDEARQIFKGPYCSTGQRSACVAEGQSIDEKEVRSMCWFVEGVVEKTDPADPGSPDRPASVPAACAKNQ